MPLKHPQSISYGQLARAARLEITRMDTLPTVYSFGVRLAARWNRLPGPAAPNLRAQACAGVWMDLTGTVSNCDILLVL